MKPNWKSKFNELSDKDKIIQKQAAHIWVQSKILAIAKTIQNNRNRALFVIEYLTGGRVGEILHRVQKNDFQSVRIEGTDYLQISNFWTEKNKEHPEREILIPISKEKLLVDMLFEYLTALKNEEDILFTIKRQRAWQIISVIVAKNKPKSINPFFNGNHWLRHCRNTHLVTLYDLDAFDLQKWNGWSDTSPAKYYVHKNKKDLARKLR